MVGSDPLSRKITAATGLKQYAAGHSSSMGMRGGEGAWGSSDDRAEGGFNVKHLRPGLRRRDA